MCSLLSGAQCNQTPEARKPEDSKDVSELLDFSVSLATQYGGAAATGNRMDAFPEQLSSMGLQQHNGVSILIPTLQRRKQMIREIDLPKVTELVHAGEDIHFRTTTSVRECTRLSVAWLSLCTFI